MTYGYWPAARARVRPRPPVIAKYADGADTRPLTRPNAAES